MNRLSKAVATLLAINVIVFLVGVYHADWKEMFIDQGALWFLGNPNFRAWQLLTNIFLHENSGHIFANMLGLFSVGPLLERRWGVARFLIFYFACGLGAGLIHTGANEIFYHRYYDRLTEAGLSSSQLSEILETGSGEVPSAPAVRTTLQKLYTVYAAPTIGASGAIYGLLVAFGLLSPNSRFFLFFIPVAIPAKYAIPGILAVDLFSAITGASFFGNNVAHVAHLGGAAIGFLLTYFWLRRRNQMEAIGGLSIV